MTFSKLNQRWEIVESFTNKTLAFMNESTSIPLGINNWYFTKSYCANFEQMSTCEEKRQLNFHKYVEPGNFCCNDGTCFTSEHVCDGTYNCATEEDEDDCAKVKLPTHYNKYDPPNEIFVNLTIVDIMDLSLIHI